MKYAIFSDVHANLEALEAVFADMDQQEVDEFVCLGDLVGYGGSPSEVMKLVYERVSLIVAGNHDYAISGKLSLEQFNTYAREAAEWTNEQLTEDQLDDLNTLPLLEMKEEMTFVHSTILAPEKFDYILTAYDAHMNFEEMETKVGFMGHSHIPVNFIYRENLHHNKDDRLDLDSDSRALVNVGSVGQPRDEDPRACYALYDSDEHLVEIRRVDYDIDTAANKIHDAGLPKLLGERLYRGK